ncbi:hypothetical protein Hanom_Chr10g00921701 [Helianthus anomalus]
MDSSRRLVAGIFVLTKRSKSLVFSKMKMSLVFTERLVGALYHSSSCMWMIY